MRPGATAPAYNDSGPAVRIAGEAENRALCEAAAHARAAFTVACLVRRVAGANARHVGTECEAALAQGEAARRSVHDGMEGTRRCDGYRCRTGKADHDVEQRMSAGTAARAWVGRGGGGRQQDNNQKTREEHPCH